MTRRAQVASVARWALGGWLLDLLARRVPDCEPIVFDAERSAADNRVVELASVTYGPDHPLAEVA